MSHFRIVFIYTEKCRNKQVTTQLLFGIYLLSLTTCFGVLFLGYLKVIWHMSLGEAIQCMLCWKLVSYICFYNIHFIASLNDIRILWPEDGLKTKGWNMLSKSLLYCSNSCTPLQFIVPTHALHYTLLFQLMHSTTLYCSNSCTPLHFIVTTHALHYTLLFQLMHFTTLYCSNSCTPLHFIVPTHALHYTLLFQLIL
jgi:hypothetical protein